MSCSHSSNSGIARRLASAITVAVIVASAITLAAQAPSGNVPPYVFTGAYTAYRITSGKMAEYYAISIGNIDLQQRAFSATLQVGNLQASGLGSTFTEPFDQHMVFLALTPAELEEAARNIVPDSLEMPGAQLSHAVTVSVPAGNFSTEEVSLNGASLWFDRKSGVLVKASGAQFWIARVDALGLASIPAWPAPVIELYSTNIPMSHAQATVSRNWIIGGVGVLLAVCLFGLGIYLLSKHRRKTTPATVVSHAQTVTSGITSAALDRVAKLKKMMDEGLITREDFEKEKTRILGT